MTSADNKRLLLYARIAGFAYLVTILLGIFSVNIAESSLIAPGDNGTTIQNIMQNEWLYRIGIGGEVMMYVLVILLAWSLYSVLKNVNRDLALLALLWRLAEAIVGAGATVISGLIPLLLLQGETETLYTLIGPLIEVRGAALDIVLIFIGMGGTLFFYLFFISQYIPKILAAWGIITYVTMLIVSIVSILSPDFPNNMKLLFYAPGGVFEIIIGLWLLIKGIDIDKSRPQTHAP